MTERLSDVTERIASVNQLATVITAMRSVAAARSHEARAQLDGIRAYRVSLPMPSAMRWHLGRPRHAPAPDNANSAARRSLRCVRNRASAATSTSACLMPSAACRQPRRAMARSFFSSGIAA